LTFRGKVAYGDLVLEYMGANSFKVLPTEQIVRRPSNKKTKTVIPVAAPVAAAKAAEAEAPVAASNGNGKKKSGKVSSKQPVAPRKKAMLTQ
jgi:pantothenate kinase